MKKLKKKEVVKLEDYGIKVNPWLTYAQIQQIVDAIKKFDTWAEREKNKDMLLMYHATDIGAERLEEIGHDMLLQSGLLYEVKLHVNNLYMIDFALEYTESIQRSLTQIARELPKYMDKVEDVIKHGGNSKK